MLTEDLSTRLRPHSEFLDTQIGLHRPVLDHGFVVLRDYMGNQDSIVDAARVSYAGASSQFTPAQNVGLLRYLLSHLHTTPFEMCEIKLHVRMPIFVARQWVRHRMASINEQSARYTKLDEDFYIPEPENCAAQSTDNKQGRGTVLTAEQAAAVQNLLREDAEAAYANYERLLNDDREHQPQLGNDPLHSYEYPGLARELARMNLSLNFYTQWVWKVDLKNLLDFLRLRCDPHAQYEIRVYAQEIERLVQGWLPDVHQAWVDYRRDAVTLSAGLFEIVKTLAQAHPTELAHTLVHLGSDRLSMREVREFVQRLGFDNIEAMLPSKA